MTRHPFRSAVAHVLVACPHVPPETDLEYATECGADVTVTLCVAPDDPEFGRGAVTVDDWTGACDCALSEDEQDTLRQRAKAAYEHAVQRSREVAV